ncbi:hypothetical protein VNO80_11508 [Phaseolus coccineus]|uniref:Uncharacterized protein n=1 Tax=Phaseolus coccineus TaxID=3886 RepID=A0AAN9RFK6_PHACN
MLGSDDGDIDVFFDSVDSLSAQDSVLAKEEFDSERCGCGCGDIWVKERRERFLQDLGLDYASSSGDFEGKEHDFSSTDQEHREADAQEFQDFDMGKRKMKNWWKGFVNERKGVEGNARSKFNAGANKTGRIKVRQNKKRWLEFSGLFIGQEVRDHKGLIWIMKFSPCGQYLASGGEDGVVRIWRVTSLINHVFVSPQKTALRIAKWDVKTLLLRRKTHANPSFSFQIISFHLLWIKLFVYGKLIVIKVLSVFHHNDYVTCIQFNPVDENYFISGSIDGKVRIWGIREERVIDWANIRDVVSAISYQEDGKLEVQIDACGKKESIRQQDYWHSVLPKKSSKVGKSSGKHIISVGEDSHVYIWNLNDLGNASPKHTKSACEYFFSKGVTVAIPWSDVKAYQRGSSSNFSHHSSEMQTQSEIAPEIRDPDRFSLGNWFAIDGTCPGYVTWPEEKLPSWDLPIAEDKYDEQQLCHKNTCQDRIVSETWGYQLW